MKQLTSYWLRMGLAALAGLIVAVLLHYFWASDKKDLVKFRQDAPVIRVEPDSWSPGAGSAGFSLVLAAVRNGSVECADHRFGVPVDCNSDNFTLL